MSRVKVGKF